MVIIVISVMGGFLDKLQESIQQLAPAVKVGTFTMTGLPRYDELCERLEATPEVDAATPVVTTLGLMQIAGRRNDVTVMGVRPKELDRIVDFRGSLFWQSEAFVEEAERRLGEPEIDPYVRTMLQQRKAEYATLDLIADGMELRANPYWVTDEQTAALPGIVPGVATIPFTRRDDQGRYMVSQHALGGEVTLTVVPMTQKGALQEPVLRRFVIANEFKSGHYEFDSSLVFVPFDELQEMLRMEAFEAPKIDPETGEETGGTVSVPGRASEVFVTGAPGVALEDLRDTVQRVIEAFEQEAEDLPPLYASTWEEENAVILGAVKNEKGMVTFLFIIISIVAVWMVWLTFNTFVVQKVRDIGVLRAIGASSTGVLSIFLGYGLTVGLIGACSGFGLAALTVYNLNELQFFLKTYLGEAAVYASAGTTGFVLGAVILLISRGKRGMTLGSFAGCGILSSLFLISVSVLVLHVFPDWATRLNDMLSWQMWDPRIYAFDKIPEHVNLKEAGFIVAGFVLASVIGALIPSIVAANVDPVETLRYE
ncbi:MAG: hypothetical protein GVY24_02345 [Planctomycetes bacterium]|nr:hypothetical protein [Planctomycetota bacterium]